MPIFLDTRGKSKWAIGICARCSEKMPYSDLIEDGNTPGLFVCSRDWDPLDPWRLPPRETEDITLDHARPDVAIDTEGVQTLWTSQVRTFLTANAVATATNLQVASALGFLQGDQIDVVLDSGAPFQTWVNQASGNAMQITRGLPYFTLAAPRSMSQSNGAPQIVLISHKPLGVTYLVDGYGNLITDGYGAPIVI